jgi:S1-C subfamily serine protease
MQRLFIILGQKSSMRKLVATSLMVGLILVIVSGCRTGNYSNVKMTDGGRASGSFKNNRLHGYATFEFKNGTKYVGYWRDGRPHGRGRLVLNNGTVQDGIWINWFFKDDKLNGQFTLNTVDGRKYVGEVRNGIANGLGTMSAWNGDSLFGMYRDGLVHGQAILTKTNGTVKEGIYENNKFKYAQKVSLPIPQGSFPTPSVKKKSEQVERKPNPKPRPSPPSKLGSTGSGFFVSKLGHIVTNAHVVKNCGSITVGDSAKKQVTVTLLETDKRNDLALLKISSTQMASADTKSLIRKLGLKLVPTASEGLLRSDDVELGEDVLVSGYPYGDIYSNTIKVTKGIVSANRGLGDDRGQFQMDAAVQPGNSGGPIYDAKGNIVGVVVAQLNKLKFAKAIGSLPENVNFGIKASTVRQFLTSSGLPTKWSQKSHSMSTKDLAKIAKNQTVMVVCNR